MENSKTSKRLTKVNPKYRDKIPPIVGKNDVKLGYFGSSDMFSTFKVPK